jgi:hypothetical protein
MDTRTRVESIEMYLRRKRREVALIAEGACGPEPKSVAEVRLILPRG